MRSGLLEIMSAGLRLGSGREALGQVLRPLLRDTPRPRATVLEGVGGRWARALLLLGCEVRREDDLPAADAERSDVLCAAPPPGDWIGAVAAHARAVRPGGMLVLVSSRRLNQAGRTALCAALLHAGLCAPVQQVSGMSLLTAGRVRP